MLIIFRQTFKKLIFSYATYIVGIVSLLMCTTFLTGTSFVDAFFSKTIVAETIFSIFFNYNTLFIWFFFPLYITINAVKFISDEIQDGTFLISLSNPVSRSKILIQKFFALQLVNMMFAISILCYIWFLILNKFPIYELWDVMMQTLSTTIYVTFLVQLFLTIILVILSLKFNPVAMMGLGISISLFGQLAPQILPKRIQKNDNAQRLGTLLEKDEYVKTNSGQKFYKKYLRPFMFVDHMQQIYWESIALQYKKYGMEERVFAESILYNKEAVFKKVEIDKKDRLGKVVKEQRYKVSELRPWVNQSKIKIYYFISSIILMLLGWIYFTKKDIV